MIVTESLVEQTDLLPNVASHEDHTGVHGEHVQDAIELPLVDLAGLQRCVRVAETVCGPTHVTQLTRVLPIHHLGTHDADTLDSRQLRRFDESLDRLGIERHIVAQQQDEVGLRSDGKSDGSVEGTCGTESRLVTNHTPRAERVDQEIVRVVRRTVVDGHDAHPLVRL